MYGYHGRFLEVDLTTRTTKDLSLSEDFLEQFIGGATLAAALVYDRVSPGMDPLGPDNPLVFATGPFTGTTIPMVSRYAVCGVSPYTGYWGEATSGGRFPFRLKGSGYDGLFIVGKADAPVYLYLDEGRAEIKDASEHWGKDSYQTQADIKAELDGDKISVACIGRAGEQMLGYACVINDAGLAAGRCGMGAVMGSKNLKAVAARGSLRPDSADPDKVKALAKEALDTINGNMVSLAFREYGTLMYTDMGMVLGDTPVRYFTRNVFPAGEVTGQSLRQAYVVENYACQGCPIGCGRKVKDFSSDLPVVDGPEYETAIAFGPLCLNTDWEPIIRANHLCNAHGIDTISAGVSIAYAFYLYDLGMLTKDQVGMELEWGDGQAVLKLVEMIIAQKGFGELLARGTLAMARELGRDEGEAAQVKGLEVPMHDGRAFQGLAVSYATSPRGACHLKGDYYNVELGGVIGEYAVMPMERLDPMGKGVMAAKYQSLKDIYDALTMCKFSPLMVGQICGVMKAITGWEFGPMDLLAAGDRSMNIKRAINIKLGVTREHDTLPEICRRPLEEGTTAGVEPALDMLLGDYYAHRGWDPETGKPTKEKLTELGLDNVAEDLYG